MAYEHKPGTGTIFKVDTKPSENYPDYKGSIALQDGKIQEIALWVRESEGKKYFSSKISNPYVKKDAPTKGDGLPF